MSPRPCRKRSAGSVTTSRSITPRYRGIADGPIVDRVSLEMAGASLQRQPDRSARSVPGRRGAAARLPRALRSRRHLLRRPRRFRRQRRALRVSVRGRDRLGVADRTMPSTSFTRTTGRAVSRRCTRAPCFGTPRNRVRCSRSTTWRIKASSTRSLGAATRLVVARLHDQRLRVLRSIELHEGRHQLLPMPITTVSPTYAEEMQRPEYGNGLDGVIRSRRDALVGILNGIDHDEWNPLADPFLPAPFDADSLDGKAAAKRALLETFGFTITDDLLARPVIGMVSRMVDQKGLDLIAAAARDLVSLDATFVIVGTGEPRYQEMWTSLSRLRARSRRRLHRLRRASRAPRRGRRRPVPDAVAVRAVRSEPDVQPALRNGAGRARGGRAGRYGAALQSEKRPGHRLPVRRLPSRGA